MHFRYLKTTIILLFPLFALAQTEWYYGPFKSWTNIKTAYHAYGDGIHDDTHALQSALNDLAKEGHAPVLFIPAGIYRITSTLLMQTRTNIAIIGENPENTIIKWDGAVNEKMFLLNGVAYSQYSRLTWDGNNKALAAYAHEWDRKVRYANSGTLHCDEVFKNIGMGLKSGPNMDAEFTIRRCRFYNCTSSGIFLGGFNALDWWIWDCYFENCRNGVSNNFPYNGAGNFHVYRSVFKRSVNADISLGNSEFFSFRDNLSYQSHCFIKASQFSNTSPVTIQGNTIINDSMVVMADMFTKGNILFLDNVFITPDPGKNYVINVSDNYRTPPADVFLAGNSFTASRQTVLPPGGHLVDWESKKGIRRISIPEPKPESFAAPARFPVMELNNTMNSDAIQSIINQAAGKKQKTVLHFSYGKYNISKTLHIPPGAELILTGDGLSSMLYWTGNLQGAVIELHAPARAILENLSIYGSAKADGLLIDDNDKKDNSIYADQLMLYHGIQTNLFVNGFSKTDLRFDNFQHNYCDKGNSVCLTGTNDKDPGLVKIIGGESSNTGNSYQLSKNARLLLYDIWYENAATSRFMTLRGKGEFVLNGSKIACTNSERQPFIDIDSFSGKIVLSEIIFNDPKKTLRFIDRYGNAYLLALGNLNWTDSTNSFFDMQSKAMHYSLMHNRQNVGKGSYPLENVGDTSSLFIGKMLETMRQTRVSVMNNKIGKGNSHLVLRRVFIDSGLNNLRIEKTQ